MKLSVKQHRPSPLAGLAVAERVFIVITTHQVFDVLISSSTSILLLTVLTTEQSKAATAAADGNLSDFQSLPRRSALAQCPSTVL